MITLRRSSTPGGVPEPGPATWWKRQATRVAVQLLVVLVAALASIELRRRVPVQLNDSTYDGILYARMGHHIASGDWLGPFTQLTLAKGPGYPMFIAAVHAIGLELKVAEQIVYLAAVAAMALALLATTRRRWLAMAAFVILALDPASFSADSAQVLRDNLFSSMGLLALCGAFLTILGAVRRSRWLWVVLGGLVTGGASAMYWLSREEGVTLLPTMGLTIAGVGLVAWWGRRGASGSSERRWHPCVRPVAAVLIIAVAAGVPISLVRAENLSRYGVALDNDLTEGAFIRAYADWSRVQAGPQEHRIPISVDQRAAVYRVSSAARDLQPRLEDPHNFWRFFGCVDPKAGCDFAGGWMPWAVRDAASSAGHFATAQDAQRFFTLLSDQINNACKRGQLTCLPRLPASLQAIQQAPTRLLAHNFLALSRDVVLARGMYDSPAGAAVVPDDMRAEYTPIVNGIPADAAAAAAQTAVFAPRLWQYQLLASVYHVLMPLLLGLSLVGVLLLVYRTARGRERSPYLLVLVLASGIGIIVREFLLALIHTAEYDADQVRYQLPSYLLLAALTMAGIGAAFPTRTLVQPAAPSEEKAAPQRAAHTNDPIDVVSQHVAAETVDLAGGHEPVPRLTGTAHGPR